MAKTKTKPKARKFQFTVTITTEASENARKIDRNRLRSNVAYLMTEYNSAETTCVPSRDIDVTYKAGRITEIK